MNDRYVETESAFADSYNQKNSGRLERLSVFPAVPTTSFKNAFKNDRITCINHNIISMEGRMTSIGSAIRNASSRSGSAVIMLLLATLLGVMAPPSLRAQVTLSTSVASPQCSTATFNLNAAVTHQFNGGYGNWAPAVGAYAQGAGVANGAVNNVALGDDEVSGEQNPVYTGGGNFLFNYWGQQINLSNDGFYISSNGFITFNNAPAATGIIPQNIPAAAAPNNAIYIANVDLDPGAGGAVWWQVQDGGAGVGQRLVITFNNVPYVNPFGANAATVQLILYAEDGVGPESDIEWQITNLPAVAGFVGTIGLESDCGTAGNAILNNAALGLAGVAYGRTPAAGGAAPISITWKDGATTIGTSTHSPAGVGPTTYSLTYASMAASAKAAGAHSYTAEVTYTFNGCNNTTTTVTSAAVPFTIVGLPTAQTVSEVGTNVCGTNASTFSVPNSNNPNIFTWSETVPGTYVASFTPNGTNAAQSTSITWNNAALSANGTAVTIGVVESTTTPTSCSGPSNTITRTIYRVPATATSISGTGIGTPAGAVGNPCAGAAGAVTYTANYAAGATGASTIYKWNISGAPAGTTVGGNAVSGGALTLWTNTNSVNIIWGTSTSNAAVTINVTASNGTGGSVGTAGADNSCAGPVSANYTINVNGVPAAENVAVTSATAICAGNTRTYQITNRASSTYAWTVSPGTAGVNWNLSYPANNQVAVQWLTAGTYSVALTETTSGGCTRTHNTLTGIVVNPVPTPLLTGAANACTYIAGAPSAGYSLNEYNYVLTGTAGNTANFTVTGGTFTVNGNNTYSTTIPVSGSVTVTVRFTAAGARTVTAQEVSAAGCTASSTVNVTVTASATPSVVSGPGIIANLATNPCATTGGHTYSVPATGNTFAFSVSGGTITATTATTATVTWNAAGPHTFQTVETTAAGCATTRVYDVNVNPQPTGSVSTATPEICVGGTATYTFNPGGTVLAGATYSWSSSAPGVATAAGAASSTTVTGAGVGTATISCTVTNPGVGGCAVTFNAGVEVIANPVNNAPLMPTPICVGSSYSFQPQTAGYTAGTNRTWTVVLTPLTGYTGAGAPVTLANNFASNTVSLALASTTIGDSSLADVLAGGTFQLTVTVTDSKGTASCTDVDTYGPFTVTAPPTRPVVNFPTLVCVTDASTYTISNLPAGVTAASVSSSGGSTFSPVNLGTGQFTATWAVGNQTVTVSHTDANCTRISTYAINVVAAPTNPQPAPVKLGGAAVGAECVDSTYFGTTPAAGLLSPQPTRVVTYQVPTASVLNNHYYQWNVTNGVIVTGGAGSYTVVPGITTTPAALNATTVTVMWTGPSPGKVKYLVYTTDPAAPAPPTTCFATSTEPNVPLPMTPALPLSFTTSDPFGTNTVCDGGSATLTLSNSTTGMQYTAEKWNGTAWVATTATSVAGNTGNPVNVSIPAADLAYVANANPYTANIFRIVARDAAYGSCDWLRTASDVETIWVYDQPDQKPVAVTTPIVCDADGVTLTIGSGANGTQTYARYSVEYRQIVPVVTGWGPVAPLTNVSGNGGVLTLTDNTQFGAGSTNALLNVDNFEYRVIADIDPALTPGGGILVPLCQTTMTDQPDARIFEEPANPGVSFTPNPVCWFDDITVNMTSTQQGVDYEVKVNGVSLATPLVINGNGGAMSATFNSNRILAANPSGSQVVNNVEVVATLVSNATYTRPVPTSGCATTYGSTNVTVNEKPAASITGSATACGSGTNTYTAGAVTPAPASYAWAITSAAPAGTTPMTGTGSTFNVTWGTFNVPCTPVAPVSSTETIRVIATNVHGCADTATHTVTLYPSPTDAIIQGDATACVYGGFEEHLETYTLSRSAGAGCVFPTGTTYAWAMSTGTVSGSIRSGQGTTAIVGEWNTTGGSGTGTVSCLVTLPGAWGGCSYTATYNVQVYTLPAPAISGPANVCQNDQNVTYAATNYPTDTYTWQVMGGTIDGGTGTGVVGDTATRSGVGLWNINVDWNDVASTNAFVRLTETSAVGCKNVTTYNVTVNPTPTPVVNGPTVVCKNSVNTWSTANNAPNNTYSWNVVGATILTGANSATASIQSGAAGFTVSVTETVVATGCTKTSTTVNVSVLDAPNPTITRDGTGAIGGACLNQTITYSDVDPTVASPSYNYQWTVTNGTVTGGTTGTTVTVTWGTVGTGSVSLTKWHDGSQCSTTVSQSVAITNNPAPAIAGPTTVCGGAEHTYSTTNVVGNTYSWSAGANGTITGGGSTNAATIEFGSPAAGSTLSTNVTVTETNTLSGCIGTATTTVTINYAPQTATIARVTGGGIAGQACEGSTIDYAAPSNTGSTYAWTVTGGNFVGASTNNTVSVLWTTVGNQTLTVTESNAGGTCSATSTLNVAVEYQPTPSISGATTVCTDETYTYSTASVAGSTYTWSLPAAGGTILTSTTSNTIDVQWTLAGNRTVEVVESNGNCTATHTISVSVGKTPTTTTITRNLGGGSVDQACAGELVTYSTPLNGSSSYQWSIVGGNFITDSDQNSVTVQWTAMGNQSITVVETTTGTTCATTVTQPVTVEYQPTPAIAGSATVCETDVESYSTASNAGSTYAWTVTGGTIISGAASSSIMVEWTTAGSQTMTVTETNASGNCSATATLTVAVSDLAGTTEITLNGAGNLNQACEGYTYTYGTDTPGASGYQYEWTVTGGQFVGGNTGETATVRWTVVGTQTISVIVTTPGTNCAVMIQENVAVTPTPQPNISGAAVACTNKDHVYMTPAVAGNTYDWTITPANAFSVIAGYPNSNVIEVKWIQPGLHTVTLTETNVAGGCETTVSMDVQVNDVPTPFISSNTGYGNPVGRRPGIVCNGSTHTYTTTATPGNTFVWEVTNGTIVTGQNTNTVEVIWGGVGIGTIAVTETVPGSDCITKLLDSIDVRRTPTPVISGNTNPCAVSIETYSTAQVDGNSYNWAVTGGTIVSGQGTNEITVQWVNTNWPNTVSGSVSVTEWVTDVLPTQSCISTSVFTTTVRPVTPTPTISGNFAVCATDLNTTPATDNQATYTTTAPAQNASVQGTIAYAWTVSANGSIVGSANGTSVNVRWFNATNAQTTGTISLTFTSSFGCTSSYTESVTINPNPTPSITGPAAVCHNDVTQYSTNGVAGNTYTWSVSGGNTIVNGQGTPNAQVRWNAPGSYTISVVERNSFGCAVTNTRTITVNQLPSITITHSGNTTFCQGGSVTLFAPEGDNYSYAWSTGETSRAIVVHTGGDYYVTVTDANGCSARSNTITVNVFPSTLPIIAVSGPTTFCEGENVTLTGPAGFAAYLWERSVDAGDTWTTVGSTQSIVVTETGGYRVTIADGNGCTGMSTVVDVFVNAKPTPSLTVVGSSSICSGDSVEVRAPLGYISYEWVGTSGAIYGATRSIIVTETETVFVRVVDANGCEGESDTITITVAPVVPASIAVSGPTTFCEGESVTFAVENSNDFATYYWTGAGSTEPNLTVNESGTYYVTVTTSAGCVYNSDPINVVVNPLPERPVITRSGDVLTANSATAAGYEWFKSNVDGDGISADPTLTVNEPGTYFVRITDANGCSSVSDGFDVILTSVDEDVVAGAAIVVFPNPTNGQFTIKGDVNVTGDVKIELVNMFGETVMNMSEIANGGTFSSSIDMGTLASGVYNVVVSTENHRWTVRVVRQ